LPDWRQKISRSRVVVVVEVVDDVVVVVVVVDVFDV